MPRLPFDFQLSVLGLSEVNHAATKSASHVVSLVDPGTALPHAIASLDSGRRLLLEVYDALDSIEGRPAPDHEDANALCRFADTLNTTNLSHLLVHCHMGRSRSAAAAAIILVRLGYSPDDAFERVRAVRDPIWPNWTLLEHGDDVLVCNGALLHACRAVYRRVEQKFARWVNDPRPESLDAMPLGAVRA
ncbi:dual specificity protein phosphatase family protein [Caballeronia telluris]|uniref:Dual specificity phosphatase, catalytic domain n=1 Tax=Caballeronia telluris TaxID=326475 RepID=A0A158KBJ4_9BURK|nr:dual specificity protein phosphatase family protein [Caballeronia telluris]SAL78512.1 Dual specificity phosphatase, catalytic domain [Caballeronia telluris]